MDINDQISIEELLQTWVNLSYKMFIGREKNKEDIETRRQIIDRLRVKGIENIMISGMDDASYTLTYKHQGNKVTKKIMIEK
ncbi:hypothetical protein [Natronincola ferrireducens]|uniref:Uncharacterized protein n=1 Tax=Natronincola ferrireducens TaxID=393762 RepID=A0A1G9IKS6_9FIRM|nr:hypothetical protein [Natronincola ferrireducens]SDL25543.1 hypothetical protein SAMN05660472_02896 [Natronincola ferrireducens]